MLLRDNLQPTDFADAECRVSDWWFADFHTAKATRIWVCRCSAYWFHRHEWQIEGKNETQFDDWIFYGYYPNKRWDAHLKPAPKLDDI